MKNHKTDNSKIKSLKEANALNEKPDKVTNPLFLENEFFDPCDLVQVKYEMIRSVKNNENSVKKAAKQFGFSRVSFYKIRDDMENEGLHSLMPKKRGPQAGYKLTPQIEDYINTIISEDQDLNSSAIAGRIKKEFQLELHKRTIERYLSRSKKNGGTEMK